MLFFLLLRAKRAQVLIRSGEVKGTLRNYRNGVGAAKKAPAMDRYRPQQRSVALIERIPLSTLGRCVDHAVCDHWSPSARCWRGPDHCTSRSIERHET